MRFKKLQETENKELKRRLAELERILQTDRNLPAEKPTDDKVVNMFTFLTYYKNMWLSNDRRMKLCFVGKKTNKCKRKLKSTKNYCQRKLKRVKSNTKLSLDFVIG